MSEDLKVKLQIYEARYEELHKTLGEITELKIILMRSKSSVEPGQFYDTFQDMAERVIADIEKVKKMCRRLHETLYPEKYEESD